MKSIWVALVAAACLCAQDSNAPNYTAAGVVNGASFTPALAPNTIVSIFGTNMSWYTRALQAEDICGGVMPTTLDNVEVYFGGFIAFLYYVSSTQINVLVPSELRPGTLQMWVDRQGIRGPFITVTLQDAAPALFQTPEGIAIATRVDGSLITPDNPAHGGEIVVLWATGLGPTMPALQNGYLPTGIQWLARMAQFGVSLNGVAVDSSGILYAGVAPGYAGLYQINVVLPDPVPANPQIQLSVGPEISAPNIVLPAS